MLGDPDFSHARCWREAAKLGACLGLPFGVVPAALLLELAPHLGFLQPAMWSFGGMLVLFTGLAKARHRAVVWVAAAAGSGLLVVFALGATAWTLSQPLVAALG